MSDYNWYIKLDTNSLIKHAYVRPRNASKEDENDVPYKVNQGKYWSLTTDTQNEYAEPKWKYLAYSVPQLVEQTKPTLIYWKNDLLAKSKGYYLNSLDVRRCTITRADIKPVYYSVDRDAITDTGSTAASGSGCIYKDESTEQDINLTNLEITQIFKFIHHIAITNKQHYVEHKRSINALASNLEYNYKSNYLINQVINLDAN